MEFLLNLCSYEHSFCSDQRPWVQSYKSWANWIKQGGFHGNRSQLHWQQVRRWCLYRWPRSEWVQYGFLVLWTENDEVLDLGKLKKKLQLVIFFELRYLRGLFSIHWLWMKKWWMKYSDYFLGNKPKKKKIKKYIHLNWWKMKQMFIFICW